MAFPLRLLEIIPTAPAATVAHYTTSLKQFALVLAAKANGRTAASFHSLARPLRWVSMAGKRAFTLPRWAAPANPRPVA
jgi:hypothetical protein